MKTEINIITLKEPCTACVILNNVSFEIIDKLKVKYKDIVVNHIELENLKMAHKIKGLEVEKFPAIIVNGEQISAGTVPNMEYLIKAIEWGSMN